MQINIVSEKLFAKRTSNQHYHFQTWKYTRVLTAVHLVFIIKRCASRWQELYCPVVNVKGIEVGQLFSLKIALNMCGKGFIIPKTVSDCKKWKIWNILCLQALHFTPKMSRLRPAIHSSLVECRQVGKQLWLLLFLVKLNPEFWSEILEEAKETLKLSLVLLAAKKKTIIESFL